MSLSFRKTAGYTQPTPYEDLNEVLGDLVSSAAGVLDDNFHAACLQGSFALGDFDEHSDVDFLIVVNDEVAAAQVPMLQAMHARIYAGQCAWAQHLEGSYIRKQVLRDYSRTGGEMWYLDHGARSLIRSDHCNSVVVRQTVRGHGITLAGPAARSLVDEIPADVLLNEVRATLRDWGASLLADERKLNSRWAQSHAVVSYCRMLQTLRTGALASKLAGVRWGMENLDGRWSGLIERAWKERPDPALKCRLPADAEEVRGTVAFIRHAIELS